MSDTAQRRDDLAPAILAGGRNATDENHRVTPDRRGTGPAAMTMRGTAPRLGRSVPLCGEAGPRATGGDISAKTKGPGA